MPDLVTSVTAAVKRQPGLALGNVVGACVFNIFFILGVCALWAFAAFTSPKGIKRSEGIILILLYTVYATKLILNVINR